MFALHRVISNSYLKRNVYIVVSLTINVHLILIDSLYCDFKSYVVNNGSLTGLFGCICPFITSRSVIATFDFHIH